MRLFALKDSTDPDASVLAVLSCYGASREYYIDMPSGTDPWNVPLVLSSFASRGLWTIGRDWSRRWVESRIVPPSRQNLGEVLKVNGLASYDTLKLLEMTQGRNSQDDCYLEPLALEKAPAWYQEREASRIVEVIALDGGRLLVAFRTDDVLLCNLEELAQEKPELTQLLHDRETLACVKVAPGGREAHWGTRASISDAELRACGKPVALTWGDLSKMAPALLVDAAEAARMLGCTRQNINTLAKRNVLPVAKTSGKATLFLRADVRARLE